MEFRILGSLEVVEHGRVLSLSGRKQRALLAALLLHANEVVSSDLLIETLWDGPRPDTAAAALQVHVSQLRKLLGHDRIETRVPGYRLRVFPDELDAARFERLLADGEARAALALWRGPALADSRYEPWAQSEIARLEELRSSALEERIEADLADGRHSQVVSELEGLVREHPLRERLRGQLMLALYRCGRQADALALYQNTRRLLVEELGIEPGPQLQELHRQLLNQAPSLAPPPVDAEEREPAPPAPREERKIVTVLFCDLVGFTSRAEQLDPEDVSALLSRYHLRLRAELERFGGTVEKFIGDAVMALFGAPVAHEDDPERAVLAALAIRDWIAEEGDALEVRIAVTTGEALVRLGARPLEGEGMAVGDVVNTASRLQQAAPPGAVVVGEAAYRATRRAVVYETLEPVEVKGKAAPVALWLATEPLERYAERAASPFIGREADLALLQQTYARAARESSLQLVTIVGEPGIGKTRLAAEVRAEVGDEPLWLQGRCLSYGEGITYWALGQLVKEHAGILESDSPEQALSKLAEAVDGVAEPGDRQWLQARLAPLVGAARSDEAVEQGEAFAAWRTFLESIAARQPLVLVIEDLHWADSALLAFVEHLVDWAADVPLLIVATARPELYERDPGWGGGKRNSTTIVLAPLTQEDTADLVAGLLAEAELPEKTRVALLERAEGNPLYAEEFVRMLADRGLLTTRDGIVQIAADAEIAVPESIHAVIAARLDTLGPDRKALLQDASVVGKVFWAGALAELSRASKEAVLAGLHELGRKELVRRARSSSIADDVEYTFWHVLVRDVAYAQIPRAERARRHVGAARWIERIAGERVTDHAEFLASHYATALELTQAAGDSEQAEELTEAAVRFGTLAAQRAARLDPSHGERYYRRTLALLPGHDPRRAKLLAAAADAGTIAGRPFEQIRPELEDAIAVLQEQGEIVAAADAMRQLSFLLWGVGASNESRVALADEARRLLERRPPGPELALVYARIAQEHLLGDRDAETIEWAAKALPLLERFGLDDEAVATRTRVAAARCALGDLGGMDELRDVARDAIDPERGYATFPVTAALGNCGTYEQWFGDGPLVAIGFMRAASELAARRGLDRPAHWQLGSLTEPFYDLGEWDEVLRINDEIAEWEVVRGQSAIGVVAPPFAVRILAARGDVAGAASLVEAFLPRARALQDAQNLLPSLAAAAAVAAAKGDLGAAGSLADEFVELTPRVASAVGYVTEIARVCTQTGELAPLERLVEASGDLSPRLDRFVSSWRAILGEARGEHSVAEPHYVRAERGWKEYGYVVERAHALAGLGRCRLALDRADAAVPLLEAHAIFTGLGARLNLAEVDELLATAAPVNL
ncbi:MAG TPA: BTAD domain-containing putative transcriptional regulator [Gaiellaceae bacterium]